MPDDGSSASVSPSRRPVEGLLRALSARLLAARSATRTLQAWCEERGIGEGPVLARRHAPAAPGTARRPDDGVLDALRLGPGEAVALREVVLLRGAVALSAAENWYVPGRLTPGMRALLDGTEAPFGLVIEPLGPRRRTVFVAVHDDGFEHHAVVTAADGRPLAVVRERYRPALAVGAPDR